MKTKMVIKTLHYFGLNFPDSLLLLGLELLLGGVADLTVLDGTTAGDLAVDGAGDAVALLHVQLGHGQTGTVQGGGSLSDVTGGSGIQDVTDDEALDGLILGDGLGGRGAADKLDFSARLRWAVPSMVTAFDSHICFEGEIQQRW